ncbi:hypothetical protein N9S87_00365 [Synechococcus sp. AH-779-G23]|nr:hypothetical protein [Synechococcus sp. AH-779-G23]MDA9638918.1 hypothetical protein [Synechococcus sp. AH-779-G23]
MGDSDSFCFGDGEYIKTNHSKHFFKMTTTTKTQPTGTHFTTKEEARINRDKDNGWGYSFAHILPLVGLYYACSRRTLTPVIFNFAGHFLIGAAIALTTGSDLESKNEKMNIKLMTLITTPLLVKAGIMTARSDKKFGLPKAD